MAYITRDDGEHFVIPAYRDVLTVKQKSALKKEILLLSQNYGEHITMQKKGANQFEVAFSPDMGYLLGESIWHFFNRPVDMIYCEAIPNTTEAILVIVKSGSVYLDGNFPVDSIPEELVIFLTQENSFEIFVYGDVPIAATAEGGKFSFEASAVKSFKVLTQPVFPTLPLVKAYQLQLVDTVLKARGIGVTSWTPFIVIFLALGGGWWLWSYLTRPAPVVAVTQPTEHPHQLYYHAMLSMNPDVLIRHIAADIKRLYTLPGWSARQIQYNADKLDVNVTSSGTPIEILFAWANTQNITVTIAGDGIHLSIPLSLSNREERPEIAPLQETLARVVDSIAKVYPGNHLSLSNFTAKGAVTMVDLNLTFSNISLLVFELIGEQLQSMPCVINSLTIDLNQGNLSGTMLIQAYGT